MLCARDGDGETGPCLSLSRSVARSTPSLRARRDSVSLFLTRLRSLSLVFLAIQSQYTAYLLSPLFVAAIPAGRKQERETRREGERERKSVRARFPTTPLRYVGERSRRLSAESACSALHMAATPHQLLSLPIALRSLLSCCSVYPRDVA